MRKLSLLCLALIASNLVATPLYAMPSNSGLTLSTVAIGKDPDNLHGVRLAFWHQPQAFVWQRANLYFAASAGHWWSSGASQHRSLNIYAIAPVLRLSITRRASFDAFAEVSIGPSYLSHTRFDDRNLGMHFAFQDELGVGAAFGKQRNFIAGISILHYSNGRMCAKNAGITAPMMINLGYKFS